MESARLDLKSSLPSLFRRCVQCPPDSSPSCPVCAADETCLLSAQSCTACPSTSCVKSGSAGPSATPSSSPSSSSSAAGPIAGGVIGGLAAIAIITWLVWRFCIKTRRQEYDDNEWPEGESGGEKGPNGFMSSRNARASTHTVGSIASTTLTRASNVIQIAYIPGVTNRSPPSTPGHLIPPVPPLPYDSSPSLNASTPQFGQDQHFFMPDLRDSTYSGVSDSDGRSSIARQSITPSLARSSVATTIYRNNAIINPTPAQTALRGKAAVVSVKSSGTTTPVESPVGTTPPVPAIDFERHAHERFAHSNSPIIARAGTARPVNVRKVSSQSKLSARNESSAGSPSTLVNHRGIRQVADEEPATTRAHQYKGDASNFEIASSDDEEPKSSVGKSLMGHDRVTSQAITEIEDSPAVNQSGFTFPSGPSLPDRNPARASTLASGHKKKGSLSQVIEEATRKASREPRHGGLGSMGSLGSFKRDPSPFSDENEVRGGQI